MRKTVYVVWCCLLAGTSTMAQQTDSVELAFLNTPVSLAGLRQPPSARYFNTPTVAVTSLMISYGVGGLYKNAFIHDLNKTTRDELQEDHPHFNTRVDNYLQNASVAGVYILNAVGVHGRHNFKDRTIIALMSKALVVGSVFALKSATHSLRPDGTTYNSFPSGHTANAFSGAEFLRMEYQDRSPWYGYAGYTSAAVTGGLRVYNNRHWVSDVVAGAAIGILCTKTAYWIFDRWINKPKKTTPVLLY